jgi:dolichol-phosphate mannosyltransferase
VKILVVVPTYNEADNIGAFLSELIQFVDANSFGKDFLILNVDDNSPDGTAAIVRKFSDPRIRQINRHKKLGLGPAYLSGFAWGLERGFDYFVEIDADSSHSINDFSKMLQASGPGKVVIGTRWMPGGSVVNWPWYRRAISLLGTKYAAMALALPYRDLTSGYRVIARNVIEAIKFDSVVAKGYGFQIEMIMKALEAGFEIVEVPITFTERTKGKSKMTLNIALEAFVNITQWGFKRIFW